MVRGRVGLVWRGERGGSVSPRAEAMLGPLLSSFAEQGLTAQHVAYSDDALEEVRSDLLSLDGALVWVNPIQDGANRALLDCLLREVSDAGVWVSARPDVIDKMGTKEVLYTTRGLGWGVDTAIYRSGDEMAEGLPARLARYGRLVVKQARGTGGNGVWRVELPERGHGENLGPNMAVLIQRADPRGPTPLERSTLGEFLEACAECFAWSGSIIDQPFQERLAEGMIRVYFVHDEVVGFCHQWPRGLLLPTGTGDSPLPATPPMEGPETPKYGSLRAKVELEWVPQMKELLGISTFDLPVIWDADFLYGERSSDTEDSYVLCEINVQAVWPYPPQATSRLTQASIERISAASAARP